jgi:hypothetical protein
MAEYDGDGFHQLVHGVGFFQKTGHIFPGEMPRRLDFAVARRDDDRNSRADGFDAVQRLLSTHNGHGHVQDHDGDGVPMLLK